MGFTLLALFIYLIGLFFIYGETHPSILKTWAVHNMKNMLLSTNFKNPLFGICILIALANVSLWFLLAALIFGGYVAKDVDVMAPAPKLEWQTKPTELTKE